MSHLLPSQCACTQNDLGWYLLDSITVVSALQVDYHSIDWSTDLNFVRNGSIPNVQTWRNEVSKWCHTQHAAGHEDSLS